MADLVVRQPKLVNPFDEGITSPLTTGIGRASEDSLRQGLVGAWCPSLTVTKSQLLPDLSGYGNNGKLTNMDPQTQWKSSGGKMALDFDGVNDYVTTALSCSNFATLTISAWIYRASNSNNFYVGAGKGSGSNRANIYIAGSTTYVTAELSVGSNYASVANSRTGWNHYLYRYQGSGGSNEAKLQLFINGSLQVLTYNATIPSSLGDVGVVEIGRTAGDSLYGTGQADDVRIYNRALTRAEIQRLYSGGPGYGLRKTKTKVFSVAAPSSFTASGVVTTGAATCSGSATFTTPVYTGTSTVTIAAATCSASGTFTKPVYSATSSVTIAAASCSASGTFTKPVYTGTIVLTVGAATASGAATFVAPVYTASASVAVGATVVNVAGSVVSPTFTGTAAVSVVAAVASGTASNNFVAGPYRVAARQVFVPGAVAFQVRTTGASASQVF